MASVDDLFRKPSLTTNSSKRKLQVSHDPTAYYKSAKTNDHSDAKGQSHHQATVADEEPQEDAEDLEAGPARPSADDEDDYGPEDDEDGRFFGGGVDAGTKQAMNYLDAHDAEEKYVEEKYDLPWVRKLGVNFEKRISRNAELRAKYEMDPQKFMASEADLDTDIKSLSILTDHPELYEEFAKLGCVTSLVGLLAHENTDIAIDAIEILDELLDEDVQATDDQLQALITAALESDLLDLLISNFSRFDETQEVDRAGVYRSLGILESLASQPTTATRICKDSQLLPLLLERIQKPEPPAGVSQNKQYSAEVLSILLQNSLENRRLLAEKHDGVDSLLQILALYRRKDPTKDTEEEEYVENICDSLTCVVDESVGKAKFIEAEGVELALIMLKDGQKLIKSRALRLLDHACAGGQGSATCEKLVEALGLKQLSSMFMKKQEAETVEHLLGIFAALLRNLPGDSAARIRTLAKFVEKDYEKVGRVVKLRADYAPRLAAVDAAIAEQKKQTVAGSPSLSSEDVAELEIEWLTRRLESGLYVLQTIDVILAWLAAEDPGARRKIVDLLAERGGSLADVKETLREQLRGIVDVEEEAVLFRDVLETLIALVG